MIIDWNMRVVYWIPEERQFITPTEVGGQVTGGVPSNYEQSMIWFENTKHFDCRTWHLYGSCACVFVLIPFLQHDGGDLSSYWWLYVIIICFRSPAGQISISQVQNMIVCTVGQSVSWQADLMWQSVQSRTKTGMNFPFGFFIPSIFMLW